MDSKAKIFVAGHRGMVGSAIVRILKARGFENVIVRGRDQLNLLDQQAVYAFLAEEKPDYMFVAAAKVGGILANNVYRGQFLFENLSIQNNLIHGSDSVDNAKGEIALWFAANELTEWTPADQTWIG